MAYQDVLFFHFHPCQCLVDNIMCSCLLKVAYYSSFWHSVIVKLEVKLFYLLKTVVSYLNVFI